MPQLDFYTFFNNHFFFSVVFCVTYFYLLTYILPPLALSLKFRRKYASFLSSFPPLPASSHSFSWNPSFSLPNQTHISIAQKHYPIQTVLAQSRVFHFSVPNSLLEKF